MTFPCCCCIISTLQEEKNFHHADLLQRADLLWDEEAAQTFLLYFSFIIDCVLDMEYWTRQAFSCNKSPVLSAETLKTSCDVCAEKQGAGGEPVVHHQLHSYWHFRNP